MTAMRHEMRDPRLLKPHQLNASIYGDGPGDLIQSVKDHGILAPPVVDPSDTIVAGHRRTAAAIAAGLAEIPVLVVSFAGPCDMLEAMLAANLHRRKTNEQIGREANALWDAYASRAGARLRSGHAIAPGEEVGKASDLVGRLLGISGRTAERARQVVLRIDDLLCGGSSADFHRATLLLERLDDSIHGAAQLMRSWAEPAANAEPIAIFDHAEDLVTATPSPSATLRTSSRAPADEYATAIAALRDLARTFDSISRTPFSERLLSLMPVSLSDLLSRPAAYLRMVADAMEKAARKGVA